LGKKEVSAQSRQAAKGFFLCVSAPLRDKQKKFVLSLPAVGLPTVGREDAKGLISLLLWEKKEVSAQRGEDAKGFFLCASAPLRA
jgi:hypothetical protein